MGISTMTRLAVEAEAAGRDRAVAVGEPRVRSGGRVAGTELTSDSDARSPWQASLDAIAAYIPSEALAVYIAAIGAFQPASTDARWLWFGIGIVLVLAFGALSALDRQTRPGMQMFAIVMVLAVVSFATYAGALPGSPFLAFHPQATVASGIVALALSFALPRVARIVGVAPTA